MPCASCVSLDAELAVEPVDSTEDPLDGVHLVFCSILSLPLEIIFEEKLTKQWNWKNQAQIEYIIKFAYQKNLFLYHNISMIVIHKFIWWYTNLVTDSGKGDFTIFDIAETIGSSWVVAQ